METKQNEGKKDMSTEKESTVPSNIPDRNIREKKQEIEQIHHESKKTLSLSALLPKNNNTNTQHSEQEKSLQRKEIHSTKKQPTSLADLRAALQSAIQKKAPLTKKRDHNSYPATSANKNNRGERMQPGQSIKL
jgi:hypothetical protein